MVFINILKKLIKSYPHQHKQLEHRSVAMSCSNIVTLACDRVAFCALLFIIYLSNVFNISSAAKFVTHVNDMSLFAIGTNPDNIVKTANTTLTFFKMTIWCYCIRVSYAVLPILS